MPNNEFLGRQVSVGLGLESTPGTEVAPATWYKQLDFDFQRQTTAIQNNSAMGRVEDNNDSAIVERWAEGKLGGKVYGQSIGYLLYNIFGTLTTSANADASGIVKNHQFDTGQSLVAPTLTVVRKDKLTNRRHGLGTLKDFELAVKASDWAMFSSTIAAKPGTTNTDTPAYAVEDSFTSKHLSVKLATNLAGLGAATALDASDLKLKIVRPVTPYFPFGSDTPSAFNTGKWSVTGEVTLRYRDTTLEDIWYNNTAQALQIALINTENTIGTSANPSLTFTAPRVRLTPFGLSSELDNVIEQTVGFAAEIDSTAGYMLRAILVNTKASY